MLQLYLLLIFIPLFLISLKIHQNFVEKDISGRNILIHAITGISLSVCLISFFALFYIALMSINLIISDLLTLQSAGIISFIIMSIVYYYDGNRLSKNKKTIFLFQNKPYIALN